jgi:hypothetical protein
MSFRSTGHPGHPLTSINDELLMSVTKDSQFVNFLKSWNVRPL